VQRGDVIRITAGFDIYLSAAGRGNARATFSPAPSELNVPLVMVTVDG
jgi:hypothetical protein